MIQQGLQRDWVRDVTIFYRRSRSEMPANPEEIKAAINEGIKIEFLVAPKKIVTENGKLKSLVLIRMKLGEMDSSGRRRPVPVPDSQFEVPLGVLIPAVSQRPDSGFAKEAGIEVTKWDTLSVDDRLLSTRVNGIFRLRGRRYRPEFCNRSNGSRKKSGCFYQQIFER